MTTFLLAWNPEKWPTTDAHQEEYASYELASPAAPAPGFWGVGSRRRGLLPGDRAFLFRQVSERGIVAAGHFTSEIYQGLHYDGSGVERSQADLVWETWLPPRDRLRVEEIERRVGEVSWNTLLGSGVKVPDAAEHELERIWSDHLDRLAAGLPEEVPPGQYPEGAQTTIKVNRYERSSEAHAACLAHWGYDCVLCGFSFAAAYGPAGVGVIHVHHLRELSLVPPGYLVDPVNDLRPVCPNCHAMIHRRTPAFSIEEIQAMLPRSATTSSE